MLNGRRAFEFEVASNDSKARPTCDIKASTLAAAAETFIVSIGFAWTSK
jgi:hypothetical protein